MTSAKGCLHSMRSFISTVYDALPMPVQKGQDAPDIQLYDDQRQPFRLSDYQGKKVALLFFPGAFTSVCTNEMNAVNDEMDRYIGEDVQIVGISTDSPFVLSTFKEKHDLQFPLLSDHDAEVAAEYGAKYDGDFTGMELDRIAKRAAFVLDRDGKVQYAEVLDSAGKMPDFDAINSTISQIN